MRRLRAAPLRVDNEIRERNRLADAGDPAAEAYRALRTNINFSRPGAVPKALVFSSIEEYDLAVDQYRRARGLAA